MEEKFERLVDALNFRGRADKLFASDLYSKRTVRKFLLRTFPAVIVEIIKTYDVARTDQVIIDRLLTLPANFAC